MTTEKGLTKKEDINQCMSLSQLVKYLPSKNRAEILALKNRGIGLLEGVRLGHGMIASSWNDCIQGEIVRHLREVGIAKGDSYQNKLSDFYIDDRVGRAPRKQLRQLKEELATLINTPLRQKLHSKNKRLRV